MEAFGWASFDPARFVTAIRHAVDMGLNFLDTAAAYGDGYSKEPVSKAITGQRGQVVIATKFNFDHSRPQDVRLSLEQSLRRLNTDYIDVLQQHWPSPDIPLVDTIGELERLKKEGKIRAIGVSNWMEPEWRSWITRAVGCLSACFRSRSGIERGCSEIWQDTGADGSALAGLRWVLYPGGITGGCVRSG